VALVAVELGDLVSNLLNVTRIAKAQIPKKGMAVAMECEVSPDTAPYLVTTSKGLVWVSHASAEGTINAAVRLKAHANEFFLDVVEAVHEAGVNLDWGNVHPMTPAGMQAAIDHVGGYELGDVEILTPTAAKEQDRGIIAMTSHFDHPQRPCSWMPKDLAVVVPKDRGFVGSVYRVTARDIVGVVHNAARGIAVVSCRLDHDTAFPDEDDTDELAGECPE
jgi:hypothetical protein